VSQQKFELSTSRIQVHNSNHYTILPSCQHAKSLWLYILKFCVKYSCVANTLVSTFCLLVHPSILSFCHSAHILHSSRCNFAFSGQHSLLYYKSMKPECYIFFIPVHFGLHWLQVCVDGDDANDNKNIIYYIIILYVTTLLLYNFYVLINNNIVRII
jgi:hypothetical protein